MISYKDIYSKYLNKRKLSKREDFVEEYIEFVSSIYWDAYLSINVGAKTETKTMPIESTSKSDEDTNHLKIREYFEKNNDAQVYLSDDKFTLTSESDINSIFWSILGEKKEVHLQVDAEKVPIIKDYLEKIVKNKSSFSDLLIDWMCIDDGYIIQLEKKSSSGKHLLRLYPDGKGTIVSTFIKKEDYLISYFKIPDRCLKTIHSLYENKVQHIISPDRYFIVDDRYIHFSVILWWGLLHIDNSIYDKLGDWQEYDQRDYSNDEYDFEIMKIIFSISEVKDLWQAHLSSEA